MAEEQREWMVRYQSEDAEYLGSEHRPCRFKTSLCPDRCNHAMVVHSFKLHHLHAEVNADSSHAKWVTPQAAGATHHVSEGQMCADTKSKACSLAAGDRVVLHWNHDYVTINKASGPDYPVVKLEKK